jgi:hypothetical protein
MLKSSNAAVRSSVSRSVVGSVAATLALAGTPVCLAQSYSLSVQTPANSIETFFRGAAGNQAVGTAGFFVEPAPFPNARTTHAFVYDPATSTFVDLHPAGYSGSFANAARGGQQVGFGFIGDGNLALLWTGTAESVTVLNNGAMSSAELTDTDGTTQVGGAITPLSGGVSFAYAWQGTPGSATALQGLNLTGSYAYAINNGRIVGTGFDVNEFLVALYWPSTTSVAVEVRPPGFDETEMNEIVGPWGVGSGSGSATGGPRHGLLFRLDDPSVFVDIHPTSDPRYRNSYPLASLKTGPGDNDFILVGAVAVEEVPGSGETFEHACVWIGPSTFIDLHSTVPAGFVLSRATGIDADGNIYGWATDLVQDNSAYIALRWTPQAARCNPADIADNGSNPGPDNRVDNGDFSLFISQFFNAGIQAACTGATIPCAAADIADNGSNPGADGLLDNGDFSLFISSFFTASCPNCAG